ncbi:MAG TPA: amino acid--[acyl-carrier-protein] ligase [Gemmatimonadaceae bacterium]|jgi:seryl-tRNA synthetase|nr:amino acid--[acyl-carrier-protein] ligase [Gemmatimonadaceae bacterium]
MGTVTDTAKETQAERFTRELIDHGLLVPSGVEGVFGKNGTFEAIIAGIDALVVESAADLDTDVFRFPPVIPRALLEKSQYLGAFPQLIGSVHSFTGDDADHAAVLRTVQESGDWGKAFSSTEVVLTPAACYPVYGMLAGTLPPSGRTIDVASYCYRHEPSPDPARMQSFRMHEVVRLGSAESCVAFRDDWLVRGARLLERVGLDAQCVPANDPFFGRRGRLLAATQREQQLKYELVVAITSKEKPTAVASANWHQDHFGELFGIHQANGATANTACVGFGLERIALALLRTHGTKVRDWRANVRATLRL